MEEAVSGILKMDGKGSGHLRQMEDSLRHRAGAVAVPRELIQAYELVEGATLAGGRRSTPSGPVLADLECICGLPPEAFRSRRPFKSLVALTPTRRFRISESGDPSMRLVDLVAPIGRGTRGLIVSPPKAGKTILLEKLAQSILAVDPEIRVLVLLVDERPEEVTQFRRAVQAEVLASTSDQSLEEHVELAELVLAHLRVELECGRNVVLLVDSLTRMARAFNLARRSSGRTMSGGLEAGALEIPRRFFGLARDVEHGGSLTLLATALVDTGSRMDQLIYEEFKGTGNSELVLDRALAEARVFPAINLPDSGTRREAELYSPNDARRLAMLRGRLAELKPREALERLRALVDRHPDNRTLLNAIPA